MPERRPTAYACEDDARARCLPLRGASAGPCATMRRARGSAACLSMRWHRSGGPRPPRRRRPARAQPRRRRCRVAGAAETAARLDSPTRRRAQGRPNRGCTASSTCGARTSRPSFAAARPLPPRSPARSSDQREGFPAFHPDVALTAGGAIARCRLRLAGSGAAAGPVLTALRGHWACLLAGWGLLACGACCRRQPRAAEVEALARLCVACPADRTAAPGALVAGYATVPRVLQAGNLRIGSASRGSAHRHRHGRSAGGARAFCVRTCP